jgi:hypothetical protein
MKKPLPQLLFWTPRILCLLFAAFLSVFALDVFEEGYGFWKTVLALLVHLIPTWLILIVLAFSWRREWVGAILFTALAALYPVLFWGRFVWYVYLLMSGPLFVVGGLFLVNWLFRRELRAHPDAGKDHPNAEPPPVSAES